MEATHFIDLLAPLWNPTGQNNLRAALAWGLSQGRKGKN